MIAIIVWGVIAIVLLGAAGAYLDPFKWGD